MTQLIIHPEGRNSIAIVVDPSPGDTSPYRCLRENIDASLEGRIAWSHKEFPRTFSAMTGDQRGKTVPLVINRLAIIGTGNTEEEAHADALRKYSDLYDALSAGGTIEYVMDDLPSNARHTFFYYLPSNRVEPVNKKSELVQSKEHAILGIEGCSRAIVVDISIDTLPLLSGNPNNPILLFSGTLQSWYDPPNQNNIVSIPASSIPGTEPMRLRIKMSPQDRVVDRVIAYSRSTGTVSNFRPTYSASSATVVSGSWSTVTDGDYPGGSYLRTIISPDDTSWKCLEFEINNPSDHMGRFAVMTVLWINPQSTEEIELYSTVMAGDIEVSNLDNRMDFMPSEIESIHLVYTGEIEIPPITVPESIDQYSVNPKVRIYIHRLGNESDDVEVRVGGIAIVDVYHAIDHSGLHLSTGEVLEWDFFLRPDTDRRYAVLDSNHAFLRPTRLAPRGDPPVLDPRDDNIIVFFSESPPQQLEITTDIQPLSERFDPNHCLFIAGGVSNSCEPRGYWYSGTQVCSDPLSTPFDMVPSFASSVRGSSIRFDLNAPVDLSNFLPPTVGSRDGILRLSIVPPAYFGEYGVTSITVRIENRKPGNPITAQEWTESVDDLTSDLCLPLRYPDNLINASPQELSRGYIDLDHVERIIITSSPSNRSVAVDYIAVEMARIDGTYFYPDPTGGKYEFRSYSGNLPPYITSAPGARHLGYYESYMKAVGTQQAGCCSNVPSTQMQRLCSSPPVYYENTHLTVALYKGSQYNNLRSGAVRNGASFIVDTDPTFQPVVGGVIYRFTTNSSVAQGSYLYATAKIEGWDRVDIELWKVLNGTSYRMFYQRDGARIGYSVSIGVIVNGDIVRLYYSPLSIPASQLFQDTYLVFEDTDNNLPPMTDSNGNAALYGLVSRGGGVIFIDHYIQDTIVSSFNAGAPLNVEIYGLPITTVPFYE